MYFRISLLLTLLIPKLTNAQVPKPLSSSEIFHEIKKLNVVANALYVAAHPDDENTLFIAYMANEKMARTGYMALTRGDGGQNLIGNEQSEYVGYLRTHELLGARSIDGGEQFFSRANDYGFTKTTAEAVETWGRDSVLADLVWRIRKFQPDVIINRFPPDQRAGHGHHSASAVLSKIAFDWAADASKFPEQLIFVQPWQAKRVVWNSYSPGFQNNAPSTEGSFIKVAISDFNPLLGKAYSELAAEARSMHKSQGFGSSKNRNQRNDYLLHVAGIPAQNDIFDNINTTWTRIEGGDVIDSKIKGILKDFNLTNPAGSVKDLVELLILIEKLPESIYKTDKLISLKKIIAAASGLWFEASTSESAYSYGEKIKLTNFAVNRSNIDIKLKKITTSPWQKDTILNQKLNYNELIQIPFELLVTKNMPISQPYWLVENWKKGLYKVDNQELRGLPIAPYNKISIFIFEIFGKEIEYTTQLQYKFVEPSDGEIYKYLEIRPQVLGNLSEEVLISSDTKSKKIELILKSSKANVTGKASLVPSNSNWKISPAEIDFEIKEKNVERKFVFSITPPATDDHATLFVNIKTEGEVLTRGLKTVDYKHIPELNVFPETKTQLIKVNIKKKGTNIGYISGAGDKVPDALKQIGYQVTMLNAQSTSENLSKFDAIVVGVRAYNTEDWLVNAQPRLLDYVYNGGNLVVQYQTNAFFGGLKLKDIGPHPFSIGRDRVSREEAAVNFINPNHQILNFPNKITKNDFEGWVQERGLYFSDKWSDKYQTIFTMKDPEEKEQEGSTLYCKYGKGNYIFTGLAFFRQLPAGVTGAYRIFSNFISVGK